MKRLILGIFALAYLASPVFAAGIVKRCTVDVDPASTPSSMDLAHALSGGGAVSFDCPQGTAVIRMTQAHTLAPGTSINGGNRVTLNAFGVTAMFDASSPGTIFISRIVLRRGASNFGLHGDGVAFGGLLFGPVNLVLSDVKVEKTRSPIAVEAIDIRGGSFTENTGTIIRALRIDINGGTEFRNNPQAVPFSPPSIGSRLEVGQQALISNASFSANRAVRWQGPIEIKQSIFNANVAADDGGGWGGALWVDGPAKIELTVRPFRRPVHQIAPQCLDKGWTGIQATLIFAPVRYLAASYSSNPSH